LKPVKQDRDLAVRVKDFQCPDQWRKKTGLADLTFRPCELDGRVKFGFNKTWAVNWLCESPTTGLQLRRGYRALLLAATVLSGSSAILLAYGFSSNHALFQRFQAGLTRIFNLSFALATLSVSTYAAAFTLFFHFLDQTVELPRWLKPTVVAGMVTMPMGLITQALGQYSSRYGAAVFVGAVLAQGLGFSLLSASALKAALM